MPDPNVFILAQVRFGHSGTGDSRLENEDALAAAAGVKRSAGLAVGGAASNRAQPQGRGNALSRCVGETRSLWGPGVVSNVALHAQLKLVQQLQPLPEPLPFSLGNAIQVWCTTVGLDFVTIPSSGRHTPNQQIWHLPLAGA